MEIRFKLNPKNEKDKAIIELLGGYVNTINVGNPIPSTLSTDTLGNKTESNTQLDSDIADFFKYMSMKIEICMKKFLKLR